MKNNRMYFSFFIMMQCTFMLTAMKEQQQQAELQQRQQQQALLTESLSLNNRPVEDQSSSRPRSDSLRLPLNHMRDKCAGKDCATRENLTNPYQCTHYFCEACKKKNTDESCPQCSGRNKECSLCQDKINENASRLQCGHIFCTECIKGYVDSGKAKIPLLNIEITALSTEHPCPVCRAEKIVIKSEHKCTYCNLTFTNNRNEDPMVSLLCPADYWRLRFNSTTHYAHKCCLENHIKIASKRSERGKKVFYCLEHGTEFDSDALLSRLYGRPVTLELTATAAH